MQPLISLHDNITKKNYTAAYNCFRDDRKKSLDYEGWAKGFKTNVSSKVSNIKVIEDSPNRMTLNFTLEAVDNPGGTRYFDGVAVVVKTNNGWKIDSMKHERKS